MALFAKTTFSSLLIVCKPSIAFLLCFPLPLLGFLPFLHNLWLFSLEFKVSLLYSVFLPKADNSLPLGRRF